MKCSGGVVYGREVRLEETGESKSLAEIEDQLGQRTNKY